MNAEFDDDVTIAHRPSRPSPDAKAELDDDDRTRPARSSELAAVIGPLDDLLDQDLRGQHPAPQAVPKAVINEPAKTQIRMAPVAATSSAVVSRAAPAGRPSPTPTAWQPPSSALAPNTQTNDRVEQHRRRQLALLLTVIFVVLVAAAAAVAVAYVVQQTGPTVVPAETPAP